MQPKRHTQARAALDQDGLSRLALHYVGRYAITQARLADYLRRKVREREWLGETAPDIVGIVARCAALGYVDDRAFAEARAVALGRRGYGGRRIGGALRAAGIDAELVAAAMPDADAARAAADAYARRKRIGPYAAVAADDATRRRQLAAMIRAGHAFDLARAFTAMVDIGFPFRDD